MATKYRLQEINQLKNSDIFVDANILIYLFWPTGSQDYEQKYASAYNLLLKQGNKLYINFLVVSEVVNVALRIEHKKYNDSNINKVDFKIYRDSQYGKEVLEDIYTIVKEDILNRSEIIDKALSKEEIEKFLVVEDIDINDKAIVEVCKENNMILLTNDRDFRNTNINLLSCNNKLF